MDYKKHISEKIHIDGVSQEEIEALIVAAPSHDMGDYALPCFKFAKLFRKSPAVIAQELASAFEPDFTIKEARAVNGYLNFVVDRNGFCRETLKQILREKQNYGSSTEGNGKTVCIDYSSINIAKPFHIGHLSTTVIGSSLYKIFNFLGYKAVGINHLGDYGTQFGKLIYAYRTWGRRRNR